MIPHDRYDFSSPDRLDDFVWVGTIVDEVAQAVCFEPVCLSHDPLERFQVRVDVGDHRDLPQAGGISRRRDKILAPNQNCDQPRSKRTNLNAIVKEIKLPST